MSGNCPSADKFTEQSKRHRLEHSRRTRKTSLSVAEDLDYWAERDGFEFWERYGMVQRLLRSAAAAVRNQAAVSLWWEEPDARLTEEAQELLAAVRQSDAHWRLKRGARS